MQAPVLCTAFDDCFILAVFFPCINSSSPFHPLDLIASFFLFFCLPPLYTSFLGFPLHPLACGRFLGLSSLQTQAYMLPCVTNVCKNNMCKNILLNMVCSLLSQIFFFPGKMANKLFTKKSSSLEL